MKDYSFGTDKEFILYYEIVGKTISIHYTEGKMGFLPHTLDNERYLIQKMEEQILKYQDNFNVNQKDQFKMLKFLYGKHLIEPAIFSLITVLSLIPGLNIISIITAVMAAHGGFKLIKRIDEVEQINEEYEKYRLFLENKKLILGEENDEIDEIIRTIRANIDDTVKLSVNNLDHISLKKLKALIESSENKHLKTEEKEPTLVFKL